MTNSNYEDELNRIANTRAEAARKRAKADENLRRELQELETLIEDYEKGLRVCPEIINIMSENPKLKECYPEYWKICAGS